MPAVGQVSVLPLASAPNISQKVRRACSVFSIESLNTSLTWVGWTLTSYQLVQIVMYPLAGKLSDALGRRRVFLFCVFTFTASSALCAMAPTVGLLIVFRAIQAVGGGGLLPSVIGMIADTYPRQRAQAIGLISSIMPIGSIIGPNLGGFLLATWSWRAMFAINIPIGIVLIVGFWLLFSTMLPYKTRPFTSRTRACEVRACNAARADLKKRLKRLA